MDETYQQLVLVREGEASNDLHFATVLISISLPCTGQRPFTLGHTNDCVIQVNTI